jgi:hypothetical protein
MMTRRSLLRALGLVGGAYFLPSLGHKRTARAATPTIPTRVLFLYTPHGWLLRQFVAPAAGASAPTETAFTVGPYMAPLSAHQKNLVLINQMSMKSNSLAQPSPDNGHYDGQTEIFTSATRADGKNAGGISIDQFIANGINSPSPVTPVPSLQLSARQNGDSPPYVTSWSGSGQLVAPITKPAAAYQRLFPSGPPTGGGPDPLQVALARRHKSILDATQAEFGALASGLSAADKTKLDAHANLVRELETSLGSTFTAPVACGPSSVPAQSTLNAAYAADCPFGAGDKCVQDCVDAFTKLVVAAFACDLTRVITLDVDTVPDSMFASNPNVAALGGIHTFLHGMDDYYSVSSTGSNPANLATANQFYSYYAQIMANLMTSLAAIPEPDGSSVLDHTIIVWLNEIGTPNHTNDTTNFVVGGGAGGAWTPGRYLNQPKTNAQPHSNFYVSLARAMGLSSVSSFGDSRACTGPMQGL